MHATNCAEMAALQVYTRRVLEQYPLLALTEPLSVVIERGDVLFAPAGYVGLVLCFELARRVASAGGMGWVGCGHVEFATDACFSVCQSVYDSARLSLSLAVLAFPAHVPSALCWPPTSACLPPDQIRPTAVHRTTTRCVHSVRNIDKLNVAISTNYVDASNWPVPREPRHCGARCCSCCFWWWCCAAASCCCRCCCRWLFCCCCRRWFQ